MGFLLFLFWICFIVFLSFAEEIDTNAFLYLFSIILYLTYYINNYKKAIKMTLKLTLLFLLIPSFLYWYFIIIENFFLKVEPISYSTLIFSMFSYFYFFIYCFSEHILYYV